MRKFLRGCLKFLVALSVLGVCTAFVGLAIGNDFVYWVGLFLAAPLYICYVLPMSLFLFGFFMVATIIIIVDGLGIRKRLIVSHSDGPSTKGQSQSPFEVKPPT
jgi:hypothetical protein